MADCCERPSKTRSRSLWIILVVLGLMLAAKALWGQQVPPHLDTGSSGACRPDTPETKEITGDVFHSSLRRGLGDHSPQNRQQGRPLGTNTSVPRPSFPFANLPETA